MGMSVWQVVFILVAVGLYLIFPISCAVVARQKSRSTFAWFALGLVFPFAILFVLIAPDLPAKTGLAD